MKAIVYNDASLLPQTFIPESKTLKLIFDYDSINIFKKIALIPPI